ncbi:hypothetical protein DBR06_SOUSAS6910041, partial [Sousa chinensis]
MKNAGAQLKMLVDTLPQKAQDSMTKLTVHGSLHSHCPAEDFPHPSAAVSTPLGDPFLIQRGESQPFGIPLLGGKNMSGDYATQTCLHTKMELSREFCLPKLNGGRFKHFDRAVGCYEGLSGPVTVLQITPSTRLMPSTYRRSKF